MPTTFASTDTKTTSYAYKTYTNDPLQARIYTLDNGLKVYLTKNKDEPRIQTFIAVRAGSKNDPSETTGLAHYLEHMLFKGTHLFGTMNWEQEEKLLKKISELYEAHKATDDNDEKKEIYQQIDSISYEASKLAIPNEYDKMITSLGAKGTNAYTSNEKTVYVNDIPAQELEKWLMVESNRFKKLVLRLFHTELETVYEEFNRGEDNDFVQSWRSLYEGLFATHPYGTQSTIGKGEHLKNPSMENIHQYFSTYYVPNNMAVCLSGDFDFDATIELIDTYFGNWKAQEIPEFKYQTEAEINTPVVYNNVGHQPDHLYMGFRVGGADTDDAIMMNLMSGILGNGQAGLFDLNLLQQQQVLEASSYPIEMKDYSAHVFFGMPREGQSLEEVRTLMWQEIDKVRRGDFEEWLVEASIRDLKYREIKKFEKNKDRAHFFVDAFILDVDYEKYVTRLDRMEQLSKQDIIDWAQKTYREDNFVVVYKGQGDRAVHKVEKPPITPVVLNRDVQSSFLSQFDRVPSGRLQPQFLDFQKDIQHGHIPSSKAADNAGVPFSYIHNTTNQTFSLYYILDMGTAHDPYLALALRYLPYLGTNKYSAQQLQQEIFKLGLRFDAHSARDKVYITLTGLDESFEAGLELLEHIISSVEPDQATYADLVDTILKERSDYKKDKNTILRKAMFNYAKYGAQSYFTDVWSNDELVNIDINELIARIKALSTYQHRIFYYGTRSMEAAQQSIATALAPSQWPLQKYPKIKVFEELEMKEDQVLFVNYDQKQVEILLLSNDGQYDKELTAPASIFNEYFGAGLSSIVFQEIREAKALAYSAYAFYTLPQRASESHYIQSYIGTQADKLNDAIDAMLALMNDMPQVQNQFESAREAALKKIESERITKESIFWNLERAKSRGLDYDLRQQIYNDIQQFDMESLQSFFDQHIQDKKFTYLIVGNRKNLDFDSLSRLGSVTELSLEEVFGY